MAVMCLSGLRGIQRMKHKLRIDPKAAEVVREIFEAAIGGMRLWRSPGC